MSGYNNNYNNNGGNNNNNNNRQQKKHSGCRMRVTKHGEEVLVGWKFSKRFGMHSLIAGRAVTKGGKEVKDAWKTKNPNYEFWRVKVKNEDPMCQPKFYNGFYNVNKKILVIPDLGVVMNPNANNGGYIGTYARRKK